MGEGLQRSRDFLWSKFKRRGYGALQLSINLYKNCTLSGLLDTGVRTSVRSDASASAGVLAFVIRFTRVAQRVAWTKVCHESLEEQGFSHILTQYRLVRCLS